VRAEQYPERGKLDYRLDVPETDGGESPPTRVVLHVGGPVGGTRLARCIFDAFAAASARFDVPATIGSVLYGGFIFPLDPASFERSFERLRPLGRWVKNQPPL
jgi:hypothetical protein